ncbi:unnamed protein product, partial [Prorocentrum cordatum]
LVKPTVDFSALAPAARSHLNHQDDVQGALTQLESAAFVFEGGENSRTQFRLRGHRLATAICFLVHECSTDFDVSGFSVSDDVVEKMEELKDEGGAFSSWLTSPLESPPGASANWGAQIDMGLEGGRLARVATELQGKVMQAMGKAAQSLAGEIKDLAPSKIRLAHPRIFADK